jgi:hypothetical protein
VRIPPLLIEHLCKGWAGGAAFAPARLIVETLQCGKLFLAHGGKDRHPFPVPITVYDQAVAKARFGRSQVGWALVAQIAGYNPCESA